MKIINLGEIAKIDISNVDKKIKDTDSPVVLCNFVDVYHNWAITNDLLPNLMKSTANENQISRFSIRKGQVAITKDSETRDDIGVSTYIADNISNGVLGYHCALITPDESILTGKYLNVVLHTPYAQKYFELNASGSGQRYTLTVDIIAGFPVPVPDIETQRIVGDFYSSIDQKITTNNRINSELESMAKTIYDYWFTQFDFPDENGKPYKSSGGKMVWNDELKREIPEGWEVKPLSYHLYCNIHTMKASDNYTYIEYLDTSNLTQNKVDYIQKVTSEEGYPSRAKRIVMDNDILYSTVRPAQCHYGIIKHSTSNLIASTGFSVLSAKKGTEYNEIFYLFITNESNSNILDSIANSSVSSYPSINSEDILNLKITLPSDIAIIKKIALKLSTIFEMISNNQKQNRELASLRDWLLPMLMNGQVGF